MAGKGRKEKEIRVHQKASKSYEYLEGARGLDVHIKPIDGGGRVLKYCRILIVPGEGDRACIELPKSSDCMNYEVLEHMIMYKLWYIAIFIIVTVL